MNLQASQLIELLGCLMSNNIDWSHFRELVCFMCSFVSMPFEFYFGYAQTLLIYYFYPNEFFGNPTIRHPSNHLVHFFYSMWLSLLFRVTIARWAFSLDLLCNYFLFNYLEQSMYESARIIHELVKNATMNVFFTLFYFLKNE